MYLCTSELEETRKKYEQIKSIFSGLENKCTHLLQLISYDGARIFCLSQFHGSLGGREIAILQLKVHLEFLISETNSASLYVKIEN